MSPIPHRRGAGPCVKLSESMRGAGVTWARVRARDKAMYLLVTAVGAWGIMQAVIHGAHFAASVPQRGAQWLTDLSMQAFVVAGEMQWLDLAATRDTADVRAGLGLSLGWPPRMLPTTTPIPALAGSDSQDALPIPAHIPGLNPLDPLQRLDMALLLSRELIAHGHTAGGGGTRLNRWGGPAFTVAWGSTWFGGPHKWINEGYFECPPPDSCAIAFFPKRVIRMRQGSPSLADVILYHRAPDDSVQMPPGYEGSYESMVDAIMADHWVNTLKRPVQNMPKSTGDEARKRREGEGDASAQIGTRMDKWLRGARKYDSDSADIVTRHALLSAENFPSLFLRNFTYPFTTEMSYRAKSLFRDGGYEYEALGGADTWPRTAQTWNHLFTRPLPLYASRRSQGRNGEATVSWASSHCYSRSGRERLIYEMRRAGLEIDVWGKTCLSNRPMSLPRPLEEEGWSPYKFHMALENSVCEDYVTEKVFFTWARGQVPIVLSAPNFADYAPSLDSFINVADFATVQDLVAHVKRVDADEVAYQKYFAWRDRPFSTYGHRLRQYIIDLLPLANWTGPGAEAVSTWHACDMCRQLKKEQQTVHKNGQGEYPPTPVEPFQCWSALGFADTPGSTSERGEVDGIVTRILHSAPPGQATDREKEIEDAWRDIGVELVLATEPSSALGPVPETLPAPDAAEALGDIVQRVLEARRESIKQAAKIKWPVSIPKRV